MPLWRAYKGLVVSQDAYLGTRRVIVAIRVGSDAMAGALLILDAGARVRHSHFSLVPRVAVNCRCVGLDCQLEDMQVGAARHSAAHALSFVNL